MNNTKDSSTEKEEGEDSFREIEDGAGCTEIWEHLSEKREE